MTRNYGRQKECEVSPRTNHACFLINESPQKLETDEHFRHVKYSSTGNSGSKLIEANYSPENASVIDRSSNFAKTQAMTFGPLKSTSLMS